MGAETSQSAGRRPAGVLAAAVMALLMALPGGAWAQEPFSFNLEETEKSPWQVGGYLEAGAGGWELNPEGALYRLRFFDQPEQPDRLHPRWAGLQLETAYQAGPLRLFFRGTGTNSGDEVASERAGVVEEAFLAFQPAPSATLELGKRVLRWGTGYAFNPVGFVERPKDPTDPEANREGFLLARGEGIGTFQTAVQNAALTLVLLPVDAGLNEDFGAAAEERVWNVAARLYALVADTDLALSALGEGTRSARWGVDFARNLSPSLEVHGEWARTREVAQPVVNASGAVSQRRRPANTWLLGLRHLSPFELTTIAEFYHNGSGYSAGELERFYRFVDDAFGTFEEGGGAQALQQARGLQGAYGRPNAGRNYLYLRLSQKEPLDILYFTAGMTTIANLDDQSGVVGPEATYTGWTNLELRLRLSWLTGGRFTEYGEKVNDGKAELRVRYFF